MWPFSARATPKPASVGAHTPPAEMSSLFVQERWLHSARSKERYKIDKKLGEGAYATVFQCSRGRDAKVFALKVTRGDPAYFASGSMEAQVLKQVRRSRFREKAPSSVTSNMQVGAYQPEHVEACSIEQPSPVGIVRCVDVFVLHGHVCTVLERLADSVYDVLKQRDFVGVPIQRIKDTAQHLLEGLAHLHSCGLSHNDIKPENLMFAKDGSCRVIDFGSATAHPSAALSKPYAQSRFYRAPEVLLGCQYSPAVDVWSAGCCLAELWLGLPLFAGGNTWDQCRRFTALLGAPPFWMVQYGTESHALFEVARNTGRRKGVLRKAHGSAQGWSGFCIKLRSEKTWKALSGRAAARDMGAWQQRYLSTTTLSRLLALHVPSAVNKGEMCERAIPTGGRAAPLDPSKPQSAETLLFCDFVARMVQVDPLSRASAQQLLRHPFVTGQADAHMLQTLMENGKTCGVVHSGDRSAAKGRRRSLTSLQALPSQSLLNWSPPPHKRWRDMVEAAQAATARNAEHIASSSSHWPQLPLSTAPVAAISQSPAATGSPLLPARRASFDAGRSGGHLLRREHTSSSLRSMMPLQSYGFLPPSVLSEGSPPPPQAAQRSMSWKGTVEQPPSLPLVPRPLISQPIVLARAGSEARALNAAARPRRSSLLAQPLATRQSSEPRSRARRFSHNDVHFGSTSSNRNSASSLCQASPPSPASSVDDDSASFCSTGYTSAPGTPMQTPFGYMRGVSIDGNGVSFIADQALSSLHLGEMAAGPIDPWEAFAASGDARAGQGSPEPLELPKDRRRGSGGSMFSLGS